MASDDGTGLDKLEQGAWQGFVRACLALRDEVDAELEAEHQLPLSSYEVLRELADAPGRRMRMCDLAEAVGLSRSGLSRLVDRLGQARLVRRQACDADGRGQFAVLTARGLRLLHRAQPVHEQAVRARFTELFSEDELERMSGYWQRILT